MRKLVPAFIIKNFENKRFNGNFNARVFFIDISGFTAMTHRLMKNGKEGAEILSSVIIKVFTPAIESIYSQGGFISSFAGDAFTAIFPRDNSDPFNVLSAAIGINRFFADQGIIATKFGEFDLSVKIGLSSDTVSWGIIFAATQKVYYFKGSAIDGAAFCEHQCEKGDIIFDENFRKELPSGVFYDCVKEKYYRFQKSKIIRDHRVIPITKNDSSQLAEFLPESIINLKIKGEFRDIISCFISFAEQDHLERKLKTMINLANNYKGYFNKIDFGDKGGVALVLFGAPIGLENLDSRACDFAYEVSRISSFRIRCGLTFGTTFTGFIGSDIRCEYTALGMVVNLSARYMMMAKWGDIYIDRFIFQNISSYSIENLGPKNFKGFPDPIPVYKLLNKKEVSSHRHFTGKIFGRESALKELHNRLIPLSEHRFGGIVYIDGNIGVGKSHLLDRFYKELTAREYHWLYFPCDEILKKSFNPIISFLEAYFHRSENCSSEENKKRFEKRFYELQQICANEDIKKELIRTKSFLGALINLYWKDSLYQNLDAKSRYENILYAIKNLNKLLSSQKPVIIEIDGLQWIDDDTVKALQTLCQNITNFPIIILASTRYRDDGTVNKIDLDNIHSWRIRLENLDEQNSKKMILDLLAKKFVKASKIPEVTFKMVWKKSKGNPFYIEQIIHYLLENSLLDRSLQLVNANIKIPTKINSLIITRIDKLSNIVKEAIKTASVLGREFYLKLLSTMLKAQSSEFYKTTINELIRVGEEKNIWIALQEMRYIFSHTLIRESVYEIQLKERLRFLHELAGKTIEELFSNKLEEHFAALAYHFEHAENNEKAIYYLSKGGEKAKYSFQNVQALDYFQRKEKILKKILNITNSADLEPISEQVSLIQDYIDTLFEQKYFLQILGKFDLTQTKVEKALKLAQKINDKERVAKAELDLGNVLKLKGDLDQAFKLLNKAFILFQEIDDKKMMGLTNLDLGIVCFWQGKKEDAFRFFERELAIFKELKDHRKYADALGNLGVIHRYMGNFETAMKYLKQQLQLSQKLKDKLQIARAMSNIGWVYEALKDYEQAMKYYQNALKLAEELGQKSEVIRICDNIGIVFQLQNKYEKALQNHFRALKMSTEINQKSSIVNVMVNIANAYKKMKDFEKALKYYNNGLRLIKTYDIKASMSEFLIEKAELLLQTKQLEEAKLILEKGLENAEVMNNQEQIEKGKLIQKKIYKLIKEVL